MHFSQWGLPGAAVTGRGVTSRERPGGRGDGGEERRGKKNGCRRERGDDCMKREKNPNKNKTRMTPVIHPAFCLFTIMFGLHSILQYMTSVPDKVITFLFTRLLLFLKHLNRLCDLCFQSHLSNRGIYRGSLAE